jgi:hypothetical protein
MIPLTLPSPSKGEVDTTRNRGEGGGDVNLLFAFVLIIPIILQATIYNMTTLITIKQVIPAKAGIQGRTGFPRIKYGAGLVKPGMTNYTGLLSLCIKLTLTPALRIRYLPFI